MRGTLRHRLLARLPVLVLVSGTMMASPAHGVTFVYVGNTESNEIHVGKNPNWIEIVDLP